MSWTLEIHHIGVIDGDATLILAKEFDDNNNGKFLGSRALLIDGGERKRATKVYKYLQDQGINKLDVMVATHYDEDHYGGLVKMMENDGRGIFNTTMIFDQGAPPSNHFNFYKDSSMVIDPNRTSDVNTTFEKYISAIKQISDKSNTTISRITTKVNSFDIVRYDKNNKDKPTIPTVQNYVSPHWLIGQEILWGSDSNTENYASNIPQGAPTVHCIAANKWVQTGNANGNAIVSFMTTNNIYDGNKRDDDWYIAYRENTEKQGKNQKSLGFIVQFGNFRYYVAGDLMTTQEDALYPYLNPNNNRAGRVTVVKPSHHGSNESTSNAFLTRLRPSTAIFSTGKKYKSHPASRIIGQLQASNLVSNYYLTYLNPNRASTPLALLTNNSATKAIVSGDWGGRWNDSPKEAKPPEKSDVYITVTDADSRVSSDSDNPKFSVHYWNASFPRYSYYPEQSSGSTEYHFLQRTNRHS